MEQIRNHPELHNQEHFFTETDCGTASCFGGWACALAGYNPEPHSWGVSATVIAPGGAREDAWNAAARLLGLSKQEAFILFSPANSRRVLELMVEDLVNGAELRDWGYYHGLVG
jgi:hypothetical protein